jgi:O-succinylbenzoate synthase
MAVRTNGPLLLDAVELVRVRLPLRRPLRASHGTESVREVVLVRVIDRNGVEGWGECSALEVPTYTGEYTDGAWAVLRDYLVPSLMSGRTPHLRGHPFATNALAMAVCDLFRRRPVSPLGSGLPRVGPDGLLWTAVLGVASSTDDLVRRASDAMVAGASGLKLKIEPGFELDSIGAVTEVFPEVPLAVDANGAYGGEEDRLVAVSRRLAEADPYPPDDLSRVRSYIEQPLSADDLVGHAALARRLAVPIAVDESIDAAGDVETVWAMGAAKLVNVKPGRHAEVGWWRGSDVPRPRSREGPGRFLGGMLETGVGRSAALWAGSGSGMRVTDLGPSSWYFDEDITDPVELGPGGRMHAPETTGLTRHPLAERLAETTVDRLLIRP